MASNTKYTTILTSIEYGNIYKIILNRPKRKNAFSKEMYNDLKNAVIEANADEKVLLICITGAGDYFTSGNDLSNYQLASNDINIEDVVKQSTGTFKAVVDTFLDSEKPIIALVNGPGVGFGVTILGLVDLAYASDKATFYTPFTKLALVPEACSSYIFPLLMGDLKAREVLMFNRKLTAKEAFERNLVTDVIPHYKFEIETAKKLEEFSKLPRNSLMRSRNLIHLRNKELLKEINKREIDALAIQVGSGDAMEGLMSFMESKTKSKL